MDPQKSPGTVSQNQHPNTVDTVTHSIAPTIINTVKRNLLSSWQKLKIKITNIVLHIKNRFKDLTFSQYCYLLACILLLSYLGDDNKGEEHAIYVGLIGGIGLLRELWVVFNKIWEHNFGKALLLVLYAATANFALAVSALKINSIAGVEPQVFDFTMGFTTLLMLPFWFLTASFIFLGSAMLLINFWLLFSFAVRIFGIRLKMHFEDKSFAILTMIMRIVLIPFLMTVMAHMIAPYVKQMDMFDQLKNISIVQKMDPMFFNPTAFENRSEQEIREIMDTLRQTSLDALSKDEIALIDNHQLSHLQVEMIRGMSDENLEKLVKRISDAAGKQSLMNISNTSPSEISIDLSTQDPKISGDNQSTEPTSEHDISQPVGPEIANETQSSEAANYEEDTRVLDHLIANFIFVFETYPYSACKKEAHQRVLQFDDNVIFVAEKDLNKELGYNFFVAPCEPNFNSAEEN